MTSIEERITRARKALMLVIAGLAADPDDTGCDQEELSAAMSEVAFKAKEELYWLTLLPAEILNMPAPDDDERAKAGGAR